MQRERGVAALLVVSLLTLVTLAVGTGYFLINTGVFTNVAGTGEEVIYPSDDQPYIKNRLVVAFRQGVTEARIQEIEGELSEFNAKAELFDADLNWYYVDFDVEQEIDYHHVISKFETYPEVELVSKSTVITQD